MTEKDIKRLKIILGIISLSLLFVSVSQLVFLVHVFFS